jgi:hypothetical protein
MMHKIAKKFLRRMIRENGFISDGIYEEFPRFWHSNNRHSSTLMDITLLHYLQKQRLIYKDKTDRFLITEKGKRFARTWYQKLFGL